MVTIEYSVIILICISMIGVVSHAIYNIIQTRKELKQIKEENRKREMSDEMKEWLSGIPSHRESINRMFQKSLEDGKNYNKIFQKWLK